MSEENQITWFVILAFIGGVTAITYAIKFMFWLLLQAMIYPVHALIALGFGAMFWYAITKK
jgi:hypothetical protein